MVDAFLSNHTDDGTPTGNRDNFLNVLYGKPLFYQARRNVRFGMRLIF
jgi:hypothetical protein